MPLYEYICNNCEKKQTRLLKLEDYLQPQMCETPGCHADKPMTKVISKPMIAVDYPGYISPATGKWVEGKKQHIEDLKRSGCRILEPGESAEEPKKAQERLKKLETEIEVAVNTTAQEMGLSVE